MNTYNKVLVKLKIRDGVIRFRQIEWDLAIKLHKRYLNGEKYIIVDVYKESFPSSYGLVCALKELGIMATVTFSRIKYTHNKGHDLKILLEI